MTDAKDEVAHSGINIGAGYSAGRVLAEAREQAGMTVDEAAAQLRLSVRQVCALESGDIAALPGPVFVRGFIRNYARLLELDATPLLASYREHTTGTDASAITLQSENIPITNREKKSWQRYMMASVLIALLLGVWMVFREGVPQRRKTAEVAAPVAHKESPVTEATTVVQLPAQLAVAASAVAPVPVESPAVAPAATATPTVAVAIPAPPQPPLSTSSARLSMTFVEASWVGVTDHDGKSLFNKKPLAGSRETVEGAPPFSVTIGNANGVQLMFNDKPIDLAPYIKANVARLTLE